MAIPLTYIVRNLWARRLTTALIAGGMALVVFVFAAALMLEEGLQRTLVETGSPANVMVIRQSAETEVQSSIDRRQAATIAVQPEIARDSTGHPLVSAESIVLVTLPKRATGKPANVVVRGISAQGLSLRPQVQLTHGRFFHPGAAEVVVGEAIARGFYHAGLNESLRFGQQDWRVVGILDAGGTAFDSEIWGDVDQFMQAFRRTDYSALLLKLADPSAFTALQERLSADPRFTVEVKREMRFYAEQSELLSNFIHILGVTLAVIFSLGATIGAMITMYAAVANRTREIGTLRALGFTRRNILIAFLAESVALSLVGGILGIALASLMQWVNVSTMNWQSFSELTFRFMLTPTIVVIALIFAIAMGLAGGVLPAARAARLAIVDALRAA